jgi:hypothetical protein
MVGENVTAVRHHPSQVNGNQSAIIWNDKWSVRKVTPTPMNAASGSIVGEVSRSQRISCIQSKHVLSDGSRASFHPDCRVFFEPIIGIHCSQQRMQAVDQFVPHGDMRNEPLPGIGQHFGVGVE